MKYHYTAAQADGRIVEGMVEADSQSEVLAYLATKELKPIAVSTVGESVLQKKIYFRKGITAIDKIFLTKHLALMLRLGTDLFRALDILVADAERPALKSFLQEIRSTLEKGQPFYTVFANYPRDFSSVFVNLVKAGETAGGLDQTFDDLSRMLSQQEDLRRRIRSALVYPALLVVGSFVIFIFLTTFALPRIAEVFLQGNLEIPLFSKVVFTVGLFFADYVWYIVGIIVFLAVAGWFFLVRTVVGQRLFLGLLNLVPVVGRVIQRIAIQRFAATLSSLMKAGVPIVSALEITADSLGHQRLGDALKRIAQEGIAQGLTLGEAFKKEPAFPLAISSLVAIAEKAGHLDEVLMTLSTFYESEIESAIKAMVSIIEPVMLIFIGIIVALIALSIVVPVYQLVGQF